MKKIIIVGGLLLLAGCVLSPDQRAVVDQLLADEVITPDQHAAIVGGTWDSILNWLGQAAGAAVFAYTGIRINRGPSAASAERAQRRAAKKAEKASTRAMQHSNDAAAR